MNITKPWRRWDVLLAVGAAALIIVVLAMVAVDRGTRRQLFFDGCDSFAYMTMAADIRQARAEHRPVNYFLQDAHTRELIAMLKQAGLPWNSWVEAVAPHGFHYFPGSGQVGPQYPPGTGWSLSFFDTADGINGANRVTIFLIGLMGLGFVFWCGWRGLAWTALMMAAGVAATLNYFFYSESYSVEVGLAPLFAGTLAEWIALEWRHQRGALLLAFLAGILFGLVAQDRLVSVLLIPVAALVFLPRKLGAFLTFCAGATINGIVPVLLHERSITGRWFEPTYRADDTWHRLSSIGSNFHYYWNEIGASPLPILVGMTIVLGVWAVRTSQKADHRCPWMWEHAGLLAAPVVATLGTLAYFLTHVARQVYYPTPGFVEASVLLVCVTGSLELWRNSQSPPRSTYFAAGLGLPSAALIFGLLHAQAIGWIGTDMPPRVVFTLPKELSAPNAWLWAERFSGTARYYGGQPAFKVCFGNPAMRKVFYDSVETKGDPQFMVEDGETMKQMMTEARQWGWKYTLVGYVQDVPCYRMTR